MDVDEVAQPTGEQQQQVPAQEAQINNQEMEEVKGMPEAGVVDVSVFLKEQLELQQR